MLGSKLHAAVCRSTPDEATIICEAILPRGVDLVVGSAPSASLIVPEWTGPPVLVVSADGLLHLGPGMRVNMCGDQGEDRIVGTYEELLANGVSLPIPIKMRRMNIHLRQGMSVFAKYVDDHAVVSR